MKTKIVSLILALALSASAMAGCSTEQNSPDGSSLPSSDITSSGDVSAQDSVKPSKDREGNDIAVPDKVERIISTAASNTEILVGLGLADKLVVVDKYSADIEGVSADIPQVNFREPDAEALIEAQPDIIIASGHNRQGDEDPFALIKEAGICVAYIPSSYSIDGICGDIEFIAALTGTEDKGQEMIDEYMNSVNQIKAIGETITEKKSVYFEIAPAPDLSSFGQNTFLNEFIEVIGATNIFADQEGWISPSAEAVIEANPDVILTNVSYVENSAEEIKGREGWNTLNAVKNDQVYLIEANPSSRPSQYSIKALIQIAKAVYPDEYAALS